MKCFRARCRPAVLLPALIGVALTACAGLEPEWEQQEERQQREAGAADGGPLLQRMDACLASLAATDERLQAQAEQLAGQGRQLTRLSQQLGELGYERPSAAGAAPVDCMPASGSGKLVVGQLERVWLPNLGLELTARVDTGAETASLDARNIKLFERNGERWVSFAIEQPASDDPLKVERKLSRMVSIIQANSAEPERRPVIRLTITMGHVNQTAEFSLSDRSHLDYQVLIGRNILQDVMMVDVSRKNIAPYVAADNAAAGSSQ